MTSYRDQEKLELQDDTPKRVTTQHIIVETDGQRFSPAAWTWEDNHNSALMRVTTPTGIAVVCAEERSFSLKKTFTTQPGYSGRPPPPSHASRARSGSRICRSIASIRIPHRSLFATYMTKERPSPPPCCSPEDSPRHPQTCTCWAVATTMMGPTAWATEGRRELVPDSTRSTSTAVTLPPNCYKSCPTNTRRICKRSRDLSPPGRDPAVHNLSARATAARKAKIGPSLS
jgi:hypothetical protein